MIASVKTRIVKIGNSQGIRIPKTLLKQVGLKDEVIVEVGDRQLVVRSAKHPREGWEESFRLLAGEAEDDDRAFVDAPSLTRFDEEEWEW